MKISIVTVALNEASLIKEALQSVAEQNYPELEHIVVDGFSTDNTADVVAGFPDVKLVEHKPRGVYDALNYGFSLASGDILGFVHANDLIPAGNVLERISAEFAADEDLDYIYGDLRYIKPGSRRHVRIYYAGNFDPSQLLGGVVPPHPTLYMRRRAMDKLGPYRLDLPTAADFDMWIRIFSDKSLKGKYLPMILSEMTIGGRSARLKARLVTNNLEKLKALRSNGLPANPLRLLQKYIIVLQNLFTAPKYE